jgi:cytochrome c oxidase subunit II
MNEVAGEFSRQGELKMMRTNRESKPMLIALALVAALAMYAGLLRGPIEEVLAQGVGGLTIGHGTLIHCPGVAVLHTDEGSLPRVINVTASKFKFIPRQIMLKKGLPVTLRLTSIDHTHCFLLRALKIDTDISSGTTTEVTVTPQVSGTFEAIGDHYGGARHGYMKMTVVVQ